MHSDNPFPEQLSLNSKHWPLCKCHWISLFIPFVGLYFQPLIEFFERISCYFNTRFDYFCHIFIQTVAMETSRGKWYQSLHTEQILEEIICDSDSDFGEITYYKVNFDQNDTDSFV